MGDCWIPIDADVACFTDEIHPLAVRLDDVLKGEDLTEPQLDYCREVLDLFIDAFAHRGLSVEHIFAQYELGALQSMRSRCSPPLGRISYKWPTSVKNFFASLSGGKFSLNFWKGPGANPWLHMA